MGIKASPRVTNRLAERYFFLREWQSYFWPQFFWDSQRLIIWRACSVLLGAALGADAKAFYASSLGDMVIFGTLVYYAFRNRVNPASHKRLILIATIALMAAAINRWPFAVIQQSPFLIMGINDAFLLLLVANDLWSLHKVHLSTLWGGLFLIIVQQLELPIGSTTIWQNFATWVLERAKSIHGA
jgi:hypothetical protein